MGGEPVSHFEGRVRPSGSGNDSFDVPRVGRSGRRRACQEGPHGLTRIRTADSDPIGSDEEDKESVVTQKFLRANLQPEFAHLPKGYRKGHFQVRECFLHEESRLKEEQIRDYIEGCDRNCSCPILTLR